MSWFRDEADALVNLDHIQQIDVVAVEGAVEGDDSHAVIATWPNGEHSVFRRGTETACNLFRERIWNKLAKVVL